MYNHSLEVHTRRENRNLQQAPRTISPYTATRKPVHSTAEPWSKLHPARNRQFHTRPQGKHCIRSLVLGTGIVDLNNPELIPMTNHYRTKHRLVLYHYLPLLACCMGRWSSTSECLLCLNLHTSARDISNSRRGSYQSRQSDRPTQNRNYIRHDN